MALSAYDHLVVRVADIEQGIATYRDTLGLVLERTGESETLRQAFFRLPDGSFIEVAAPKAPDSAVGRALARRGAGIHTIAFRVDDLPAACGQLAARGARVIGADGRRAFVHPQSACGVLLQLVEKA